MLLKMFGDRIVNPLRKQIENDRIDK